MKMLVTVLSFVAISSTTWAQTEASTLRGALRPDSKCSSGYSLMGSDFSDSSVIQRCASLDSQLKIDQDLKKISDLMISNAIVSSLEAAIVRFQVLDFTIVDTDQGFKILAVSKPAG